MNESEVKVICICIAKTETETHVRWIGFWTDLVCLGFWFDDTGSFVKF